MTRRSFPSLSNLQLRTLRGVSHVQNIRGKRRWVEGRAGRGRDLVFGGALTPRALRGVLSVTPASDVQTHQCGEGRSLTPTLAGHSFISPQVYLFFSFPSVDSKENSIRTRRRRECDSVPLNLQECVKEQSVPVGLMRMKNASDVLLLKKSGPLILNRLHLVCVSVRRSVCVDFNRSVS